MIKKTTSSIKKGFVITKRALLKVFRISYWFDWERVKAGTLYLRRSIVRLFSPETEVKPQSFKAAVHHFKLNDAELLIKQKALFRLSLLMLSAASLIFVYFIYQLIYGTFHAALLSLIVMGIALVLAFRYHFWYFQIKNRKLGYTFQEWLKALRGKSHE